MFIFGLNKGHVRRIIFARPGTSWSTIDLPLQILQIILGNLFGTVKTFVRILYIIEQTSVIPFPLFIANVFNHAINKVLESTRKNVVLDAIEDENVTIGTIADQGPSLFVPEAKIGSNHPFLHVWDGEQDVGQDLGDQDNSKQNVKKPEDQKHLFVQDVEVEDTLGVVVFLVAIVTKYLIVASCDLKWNNWVSTLICFAVSFFVRHTFGKT